MIVLFLLYHVRPLLIKGCIHIMYGALCINPMSEDMLQLWIGNEKDTILHSSSESSMSWKTTYF